MNKALLDSKSVAEMLGVTYQTLVIWRNKGIFDVVPALIGNKKYYSSKDVQRWIDSRKATA
jgi:DNA-binding transcriptional MerR regulator